MRVIGRSPDPLARMHTMTKRQGRSGTVDVKAVLPEDEEFLRAWCRRGGARGSRSRDDRGLGRREGPAHGGTAGLAVSVYGRTLITRVGKLELRVRRTGRDGSRPSCSNPISVRSGRWWRRWRRCMCKGFDPQSQRDHRGVVRPQPLGCGDQCDEPAAGCFRPRQLQL
jgi:hypothetical protein